MAKTPQKPPAKKSKAAPKRRFSRNLRTRAFGEAVDGFSREIAPLGPTGAVARRVNQLLFGLLERSVFGLEQVGDWLQAAVAERLEDVPEEKIIQPDPRIAVPAVQALVYSMNDEIIREMFANLLASSMSQETQSAAHPAFVEMIKVMEPIDAQALIQFRGGNNHINYQIKFVAGSTWISVGEEFSITKVDARDLPRVVDNLGRMGLIEKRETESPLLEGFDIRDNKDNRQRDIETRYKSMFEAWNARQMNTPPQHRTLQINRRGLYITPLGNSFLKACMSKVEATASKQPT